MVINYPVTVTTCNALFTEYDFLQKFPGNTPESKILHLKFPTFSGGDTPAPLMGEGDPLLHPMHGLCPRSCSNLRPDSWQPYLHSLCKVSK